VASPFGWGTLAASSLVVEAIFAIRFRTGIHQLD
jgi:hypothetical protein